MRPPSKKQPALIASKAPWTIWAYTSRNSYAICSEPHLTTTGLPKRKGMNILCQRQLICPTHVHQIFIHGPHRHLELYRQYPVVIHQRLACTLQKLGTVNVIERMRGLQHQRIKFRVGIMTPVGGTQPTCGVPSNSQ